MAFVTITRTRTDKESLCRLSTRCLAGPLQTNNTYLERALNSAVYDFCKVTSLKHAPLLSERFDNDIYIKREDEQPVFSFKLRGACSKVLSLPKEQLQKGVVCASAGNHALGCAFVAHRLQIPVTIVMPLVTPKIKVDACRRYGANVVLHGDSFDEAKRHALDICLEERKCMIPPFDDPDVIAGQATIGIELLQQIKHTKPLEAVFAAVGGGGLVSGIASVVKRLRPDVKVFGVESVEADAMYQSLKAGERVTLSNVGGAFADGAAVKVVGEETFRVCRELLDGVVRVETDEICAAIKDVFDDTRAILEPSGALGVAGLKKYVQTAGVSDKTLIAIASGANMNFDRLRHVSERAEIGEGREAILAVRIPERPGSFRSFIQTLGDVNITEFNYRNSGQPQADIYVGIQVANLAERKSVVATLRDSGYDVSDLSDNETAKLHVRHMVGGRPGRDCGNERFYRFSFPERRGALSRFLDQMNPQIVDISLFHYRNHGTDVGRVLAGILVDPSNSAQFDKFLGDLGYEYADETTNDCLRRFLV
eukprot:Rmarinus@m.7063